MDEPRARILYVDRDEPGCMHELRLEVLAELQQAFDVDAVIDLEPYVVELVQRATNQRRPYAAIVTHLPPDRDFHHGGYPYSQTGQILAKLAALTGAPVIAFTGAARPDIQPMMDRLDLVFQGERGKRPGVALRETIARFIATPYSPKDIPPPVLTRRDQWTVVEAIVKLRGGLQAFAASQLMRLTKTFPGEIRIANLTFEPDCPVNAKELFGLLMLAADTGHRIEIAVSGSTPEADVLARRLYAIVTSRFAGAVDLDRFVTAPVRPAPPVTPIKDDPTSRPL